ncbi:DoxX family protein [uncultured Lentibacter sp.]|uniref:DoxX family protein n=1 Tax=uncultured Lentibacter sp. TaxID=1659309 RepID=UPI0026022C69|nr:DoxX family protein [uncultured Lentibacter sp.]MCW1954658.1 DoxX family protein [Roseobacter sp.]
MTHQTNIALLIARVFLALLFIMAGLGKLANVEGFAGFMASGGIPAFLAWPVILFEILGGLAILAGFMTRPVALALGAFCLVSGLLYHFDPADQAQMTNFLKNVALTGGYIALAIAGAGKFSLDGRKA